MGGGGKGNASRVLNLAAFRVLQGRVKIYDKQTSFIGTTKVVSRQNIDLYLSTAITVRFLYST
jgi:hypothetical protein